VRPRLYGSAYRRLSWDEPSLTITTWVYHVGSGRFAHPVEDRGITMREAARMQSFDDAFVFPPLVNPVSQMSGNAVSPMVANRFAMEFVRVLDVYASRTKLTVAEPMRARGAGGWRWLVLSDDADSGSAPARLSRRSISRLSCTTKLASCSPEF